MREAGVMEESKAPAGGGSFFRKLEGGVASIIDWKIGRLELEN